MNAHSVLGHSSYWHPSDAHKWAWCLPSAFGLAFRVDTWFGWRHREAAPNVESCHSFLSLSLPAQLWKREVWEDALSSVEQGCHDHFDLSEEQAESRKIGAGYNFPAPVYMLPVVTNVP